MIRSTVTLITALLLLCSCVFASGFQYPGIGTKARGMGGAFRAVADNWTAAYYNPAGYAFLADNEIGFSQGFAHPRHELTPNYTFTADGYSYDFGVFDETLYNHHEILSMPAGGFAVRLPLFGEIVWGLSAYQPFDNNVTWSVWQPLAAYNNTIGDNVPADQFKADIDIVTFQMTTAKSFKDDRLSVGFGLQLLRADIWMRDFIVRPNPVWNDRPKDFVAEFTSHDGSAWGFGLNVGLMYKATEKLNVAVTASIPTEFDIEGTAFQEYVVPSATTSDTSLFLGGAADSAFRVDSDFRTKIKLPAVLGVGLAYQMNDKLTLALDAEYTLWSKFEGMSFEYYNYILSGKITESSDPAFFQQNTSNPTVWDDCGKVALGAHYQYSDIVGFMGGMSVEQSPLRNSLYFTPWFPEAGTKYGFSGGLQLSFERWELGLITSFYDYPNEEEITWTEDADGDGVTDSFPGTYKSAAVETILSVNYRF